MEEPTRLDIKEDETKSLEEEVDPPMYYDADKPACCVHYILLNRGVQVVFALAAVAITAPILVYIIYFDGVTQLNAPQGSKLSYGTCAHIPMHRVPCGPKGIAELQCTIALCCFEQYYGCYHKLPSSYSYLSTGKWNWNTPYTPRQKTTHLFKPAIPTLKLAINDVTDSHLQIVLYDPSLTTVPQLDPVESPKYSVQILNPELFIQVDRIRNQHPENTATEFREQTRKSGTRHPVAKADADANNRLLSTTRGPLSVSKGLLEWGFYLGEGPLYGLGDLLIKSGEKRLMYNNGVNSTLPVIITFNNVTGEWHGVMFSATGAVEIETIESGLIMVRSLATSQIRIDVFIGPTMDELTAQLKTVTGDRKTPPYWAMGVHVCSQSNTTDDVQNAAAELDIFLTESKDGGVPFDSHCLQESMVWLTNSGSDEDVETSLENLKNEGKRFIASVVPHIATDENHAAYTSAVENNLLLTYPNGSIYEGLFQNRTTVYPDWVFATGVDVWFKEHWTRVIGDIGVTPDGYVLSSQWPRDDTVNVVTPSNTNFPYLPEYMDSSLNGTALNGTILWSSVHTDAQSTPHYSVHNAYGARHTAAMLELLPQGSYVVSTAYEVGGLGISQNIPPTWAMLRDAVRRTIGQSLINTQFTGFPVCGDTGSKPGDELCIRWHLTASVFPIFRVFADRSALGYSGNVRKSLVSAMRIRYALLPYIYTVIQTTKPLLRPMFYEYPESIKVTGNMEEQFMVGDALLVAPALLPSLTRVRAFFPEKYYELWAGGVVPAGWNDVSVVISDLPLFIRPGRVIATQELTSQLTAEGARVTPYTVVVALKCNTVCSAAGTLYVEDGVLWTFTANDTTLAISISEPPGGTNGIETLLCGDGKSINPVASSKIGAVRVYGAPGFAHTLYISPTGINVCSAEGVVTTFTVDFK